MNLHNPKIYFREKDITEKKKHLLDHGKLSVISFRYPNDIAGLEIINTKGKITHLPFQGQRIWDVEFNGRRLDMRSPVRQPNPNRDFLMNLGGFFFHCGMSAMGSPGPHDLHPIHGELVNAPYQTAFLESGEDEKGKYVVVGGDYEHAVAFGHHYLAQPTIKLYEHQSLIYLSMRVINLQNSPMEYMYLAHINFRPVNNGRFVYSAIYDAQHIRVRTAFPGFMKPSNGMKETMRKFAEDPTLHHVIRPEYTFDPEIVFMIDYEQDDDGWAHAMHIHPDGTADYVTHKPSQLDKGIRWISRTPDLEALGMEAGTAGTEGYTMEKAKGNVKLLGVGEEFICEIVAGVLDEGETKKMEEKIRQYGKAKK